MLPIMPRIPENCRQLGAIIPEEISDKLDEAVMADWRLNKSAVTASALLAWLALPIEERVARVRSLIDAQAAGDLEELVREAVKRSGAEERAAPKGMRRGPGRPVGTPKVARRTK